jgi:hypothetical protein
LLLTAAAGREAAAPRFVDNEAPGSDGNSGNVATSGKVAMAAGDDSEPVTPAMIAVGLSQLPPMDETFAHLVETVEAVYRAMRKVARAGEH